MLLQDLATVILSKSMFSDSTAATGGGIELDGSAASLFIKHSGLTDNKASAFGGGTRQFMGASQSFPRRFLGNVNQVCCIFACFFGS